jgi:two-component system OmpR family response regulator
MFLAKLILPSYFCAAAKATHGFSLRSRLCFMLSMRILVVEDDSKIASFVVKGLRQHGFAVDHAQDGEEGLSSIRTVTYDAAILDIMLPRLDGLSLLRQARQEHIFTPILILSAKVSVDDRITGLQAGGDDYMTKPFAFSELLARVQALIRRATHTVEPAKLSAGDITMDLISREVTRAGQKIELQGREFALLELLLRYPGKVVTKTMILEHIWDYSFDPQTNVVDVLVHRLRAKVDKDFPVKMIQTIRGVGYVLKPV